MAPGEEPDEAGRSGALTDRQLAVLKLEAASWPSRYAQERAVRERLGMSSVRYHQVLVALIAEPAAWAVAPQVMASVRRGLQAAGVDGVGLG